MTASHRKPGRAESWDCYLKKPAAATASRNNTAPLTCRTNSMMCSRPSGYKRLYSLLTFMYFAVYIQQSAIC